MAYSVLTVILSWLISNRKAYIVISNISDPYKVVKIYSREPSPSYESGYWEMSLCIYNSAFKESLRVDVHNDTN